MRPIEFLVMHCSATPPAVNWHARDIRRVHIEEKGYSDIGYHFVITRAGAVEPGRAIDKVGSHVRGWNARTIGICLVGGINERGRPQDNYTPAQWKAAERLVRDLSARFPAAKIIGHRDFPRVAKACPCYDAIAWAQKLGVPAARRRPAVASMVKAIRQETEREDERDDDQLAETPGDAPTSGAGGRKPIFQRRSFWRDATGLGGGGGLMALSYFNGFDPLSLVILLAVASAWAAVFIYLFRKEIFG